MFLRSAARAVPFVWVAGCASYGAYKGAHHSSVTYKGDLTDRVMFAVAGSAVGAMLGTWAGLTVPIWGPVLVYQTVTEEK